jgi:hypothetical protein
MRRQYQNITLDIIKESAARYEVTTRAAQVVPRRLYALDSCLPLLFFLRCCVIRVSLRIPGLSLLFAEHFPYIDSKSLLRETKRRSILALKALNGHERDRFDLYFGTKSS